MCSLYQRTCLPVHYLLASMSNINHLRKTLSILPFFGTVTVDFLLCSMTGTKVWCSESLDVDNQPRFLDLSVDIGVFPTAGTVTLLWDFLTFLVSDVFVTTDVDEMDSGVDRINAFSEVVLDRTGSSEPDPEATVNIDMVAFAFSDEIEVSRMSSSKSSQPPILIR